VSQSLVFLGEEREGENVGMWFPTLGGTQRLDEFPDRKRHRKRRKEKNTHK
jgi:hypothetical protein